MSEWKQVELWLYYNGFFDASKNLKDIKRAWPNPKELLENYAYFDKHVKNRITS